MSSNSSTSRKKSPSSNSSTSRKKSPSSNSSTSPKKSPSSNSSTSPKKSPSRAFNNMMKNRCWDKARVVPGRDPTRWLTDPVGNTVCRKLNDCEGPACFEFDHIIPYSKGGKTKVDNCQILQQKVNRFKSNKENVDINELRSSSCDYKFKIRSSILLKRLYTITQKIRAEMSNLKYVLVFAAIVTVVEELIPGNQSRSNSVEELNQKIKSLPANEGQRGGGRGAESKT